VKAATRRDHNHFMGMETNGLAKDQGTLSPADLILQQRRDATTPAVSQPNGDGGLFSQLANNPFFTAVGHIQ